MDAKVVMFSVCSSSYVNLNKNFARHIPIVEKENVDERLKKELPWVHLVIGEFRNGIAAINTILTPPYYYHIYQNFRLEFVYIHRQSYLITSLSLLLSTKSTNFSGVICPDSPNLYVACESIFIS